jgi:hypothetical protein
VDLSTSFARPAHKDMAGAHDARLQCRCRPHRMCRTRGACAQGRVSARRARRARRGPGPGHAASSRLLPAAHAAMQQRTPVSPVRQPQSVKASASSA